MRDFVLDHFASMIANSNIEKMLNHLKLFCLRVAPQGLKFERTGIEFCKVGLSSAFRIFDIRKTRPIVSLLSNSSGGNCHYIGFLMRKDTDIPLSLWW